MRNSWGDPVRRSDDMPRFAMVIMGGLLLAVTLLALTLILALVVLVVYGVWSVIT